MNLQTVQSHRRSSLHKAVCSILVHNFFRAAIGSGALVANATLHFRWLAPADQQFRRRR